MPKASSSSVGATRKHVVYVSGKWRDRLQLHRDRTGISMSHAAESALALYFEVEAPIYEQKAEKARAALGSK